MSTYRLHTLFHPSSVALVGASPRPHSVGRTILRNLRSAGFGGRIDLVNPRYPSIDGLATVPRLEDLPAAPDLVVIATPPHAVRDIVAASAAKGAAVCIIVTAGLGRGPGSIAAAVEAAARPHGLRIVGPNCLGVISTAAKLNASFAAGMPLPGDLALLSQSGAVASGLIEWASRRAVGFSAVVSLGDSLDVDFGDLLDFFAMDRGTRAVLLYIESIKDARKFMSAARAAARAKPIVAIKAGRHAQGAKAALTHTGALAGSDAVYDAALRRAGLLRVFDLDDLFAATETLARIGPFRGRRLALLTNGGGIGVLAVDRLIDLGGTVAAISDETMRRLDAVLPPTWSRANPVDIIGDADANRYVAALDALLGDPENDAVMVFNVPTGLGSPKEAARAVIDTVERHRQPGLRQKPVFAVWVGAAPETEQAFESARLPHFQNEGDAVRGFMQLVRYGEAQENLMETPPSLPQDFVPDVAAARRIVAEALKAGETWLGPLAVNGVLQAYEIPVAPVYLARTPEEAGERAQSILDGGAPVAVKVLSPDIVHKSEVGGVRLNVTSAAAARDAAADILARARARRPDARITGVTVQPMIVKPKARELIAGLADDPTFGPVLVFGRGGTAVEVINDKALELPPLDLHLARQLIARTRVARILKPYRDVPAADVDAVALVLVKLAQLAADIPEIRELDMNPILADKDGVICVDARMMVAPVPPTPGRAGHPRFAIRPYPSEWERHLTMRDGRPVFVRPVRPEDEPLFRAFLAHISAEDLRLRFFAPVKELSHAFIARLTQLDYARAMAFVAVDQASGEMLGVVRLHADANYEQGEYAVLVRSDLKGRGLGWQLMELMISYAQAMGLKTVEGQVLRENTGMLRMCRELGFTIRPDPHDSEMRLVTLALDRPRAGGASA